MLQSYLMNYPCFLFLRKTFWTIQNPSCQILKRTLMRPCQCWITMANPQPPTLIPAARNKLSTVPTTLHLNGRVQRRRSNPKMIYSTRDRVQIHTLNSLQPKAPSCQRCHGARNPCKAGGNKRRRIDGWRCDSRGNWTAITPWIAGRVRPTAISSGKKTAWLPQAQTRMRTTQKGKVQRAPQDRGRTRKKLVRNCLEQAPT